MSFRLNGCQPRPQLCIEAAQEAPRLIAQEGCFSVPDCTWQNSAPALEQRQHEDREPLITYFGPALR